MYPLLYQVNTRIALHELGESLGRPATLDDLPESQLDAWQEAGFDWIWLLGVWQTGAAGRRVSRREPSWRHEYQLTLPDLHEDDITGSPFAVTGYQASADFGGDAALARIRDRLRKRGIKLMLDFVPNHTAIDHPWVRDHPEYYIAGDGPLLEKEPANYCRVETRHGPQILAHGRDPYFPGWPDTLQLNHRHPGVRRAMVDELKAISARCDGVRCDMAMLILPSIIKRTWGALSLPADEATPVDSSFWTEAIGEVHAQQHGFVFMAEVYWDLEWELQQEGFAYTYDKRLYDRLHGLDAWAVRGHLHAYLEFQNRSVRFLENHDEARVAATFDRPVHKAAAVISFLVPGLRFLHDGQLDGRRARVSMHLGRRPEEPVDPELHAFYETLLPVLKRPEPRAGSWSLLDIHPAWDGNPTWGKFLTYRWDPVVPGPFLVVAVNFAPGEGQCFVDLGRDDLHGDRFRFRDLMSHARYEHGGDDLTTRGLYLDMPGWGYHVFEVSRL